MRPRLYTADWVLPVTAPPIAQGAMLVDEAGRIARVGAATDMHDVSDVERVDLGRALLLPGLINVHAHPELAAFRGLLDDLPFHQWIPTLVRCKREAPLCFDDYLTAASWTCVESLRAGITTMGATEDSGAAATALREAGMRGVVYLEVFGPDPSQCSTSMSELHAKVERLRAETTADVRVGVSPHAPYTVSDDLYRAVAEYARQNDLAVAAHAAVAEAEELLVRAGQGPFAAGQRSRGIATEPRADSTIQLLHDTGILECAPLLIHAIRVNEKDLEKIDRCDATVAHCPIANARLGHGIARVIEMREAGITVALGTDSVASNNRLDLLEEARAAQALQRARLQSAGALSSAELLRMVTIDAARVLRMADRIGSLEAGKDADFCVVSLAAPHNVPAPDPLQALFHSARGSDVIMTAVRGEVLYNHGQLTRFDTEELGAAMHGTSERLLKVRAGV